MYIFRFRAAAARIENLLHLDKFLFETIAHQLINEQKSYHPLRSLGERGAVKKE